MILYGQVRKAKTCRKKDWKPRRSKERVKFGIAAVIILVLQVHLPYVSER
jgi:hypothetical protein